MRIADLGTALDWAAAEGWNPGLDDASAFLAADSRGFLMGWIGEEAVACISVVRHSPVFGFLGLYLCRPAWRGRGYGWALWQAGLAHLGDRSIGLDGVLAQQANYRRSGFVGTGRTIRHVGTLAPGPAGDLVAASRHLPALAALDRRATGIDRPAFLAAWLADTATRRTLALVQGGEARAFGTVRICREGLKIGPLIAPDRSDALGLLGALAGRFPDRPIAIDVPEFEPGRRRPRGEPRPPTRLRDGPHVSWPRPERAAGSGLGRGDPRARLRTRARRPEPGGAGGRRRGRRRGRWRRRGGYRRAPARSAGGRRLRGRRSPPRA